LFILRNSRWYTKFFVVTNRFPLPYFKIKKIKKTRILLFNLIACVLLFQYTLAGEILQKLGDTKKLIKLYVESHQWEEVHSILLHNCLNSVFMFHWGKISSSYTILLHEISAIVMKTG